MTGEIARFDAAFATRSTALMAARATDAAGPSAKIIPFHRSSAVANHAAGGNPGGVWTARPAGDPCRRARRRRRHGPTPRRGRGGARR